MKLTKAERERVVGKWPHCQDTVTEILDDVDCVLETRVEKDPTHLTRDEGRKHLTPCKACGGNWENVLDIALRRAKLEGVLQFIGDPEGCMPGWMKDQNREWAIEVAHKMFGSTGENEA